MESRSASSRVCSTMCDAGVVPVAVEVAVLVHVAAARPVAALAGDPEVEPGGVVTVFTRTEALHLVAHVAAETVLVPQLDRDDSLLLIRRRDLEVVKPLAPQDVPGRRQHDDPPVVERGEVVLDPPVAERVVDPVPLRRPGEEALGDEVLAVLHLEPVFVASEVHFPGVEVAAGPLRGAPAAPSSSAVRKPRSRAPTRDRPRTRRCPP